jgi:hypothetical protein
VVEALVVRSLLLRLAAAEVVELAAQEVWALRQAVRVACPLQQPMAQAVRASREVQQSARQQMQSSVALVELVLHQHLLRHRLADRRCVAAVEEVRADLTAQRRRTLRAALAVLPDRTRLAAVALLVRMVRHLRQERLVVQPILRAAGSVAVVVGRASRHRRMALLEALGEQAAAAEVVAVSA